jgi:hypothetical protein
MRRCLHDAPPLRQNPTPFVLHRSRIDRLSYAEPRTSARSYTSFDLPRRKSKSTYYLQLPFAELKVLTKRPFQEYFAPCKLRNRRQRHLSEKYFARFTVGEIPTGTIPHVFPSSANFITGHIA